MGLKITLSFNKGKFVNFEFDVGINLKVISLIFTRTSFEEALNKLNHWLA